jgi:hypothetical protein
MLEKGYRGFKEGQYRKCKGCRKITENLRMYIRTRKYAYDYDIGIFGPSNPRQFQPIGWVCLKCKHVEIDDKIPMPIQLTKKDIKITNQDIRKGPHTFEVTK